MSVHLTRDELADLVGCQPTSRACMRRWLTRNGWPYEVDRNGLPKVSRAYYEARLTGRQQTQAGMAVSEPNFAALEVA